MYWFALGGAVALAGATAPVEGQNPVDTDPETVAADATVDTIAMERERFRRWTIPVTIMGEGPFDFLVDTGAQATVLSKDLADQLQLFDRDSATLIGMASTRPVETTLVPDFAFGSRTLTIRTAPLLEGSNIGGADGILGLDSLQDQKLVIDFEHGEMHVADSFDDGSGAASYDIVVRARERLGQLIIHRARIDGVNTAVIIDTGAMGSFGNLALRDRLNRRRTLDDATMTDVNGVQISGELRVARRLTMDRVQLNNFAIAFADSPTFHALGLVDRPAMVLGMTELRIFRRVAIDFSSQRVLFDLPRSAILQNEWNFGSRATRLD